MLRETLSIEVREARFSLLGGEQIEGVSPEDERLEAYLPTKLHILERRPVQVLASHRGKL
ncbi:hypothetical protein D3C77_753990 [compost metagenome]